MVLQSKNLSLKDRLPFKGVLLDIYGVLEYKGEPCAGAMDFINHLLNNNIPFRLLSNSTLQSRQSMAEKLQKLGFTGVMPEHVVTASSASAAYLRSVNARSIRVIIDGRGTDEFKEFAVDEENPEFLVLGDARDGFTFANINRMYNQLLAGAKLLVMIPNITSIEKTGPEITVGGYGKMLELATGHAGVWIGKPSRMMFDIALNDLNLNNREVLMVGDNIDIDVDGARNAGIAGALVLTGEYSEKELPLNNSADYTITNLLQLTQLL